MTAPNNARPSTTRRTVRLRIEVDCCGQVRTALLREFLAAKLRQIGEAEVAGTKRTLPNPEASIRFTALFGGARVLQGGGK